MSSILILLFSLFLFASPSSSSRPHHHHHKPPPLNPSSSTVSQIRLACKATRYPDQCLSSLSQPGLVPQDPNPSQIIHSAISVSFKNLVTAQSKLKSILDASVGNLNRTNAAATCLELLSYSKRRTLSTDHALTRGRIKDARAWMSAALVYQYDTWSALKYVNDTTQVGETMSFIDGVLLHVTSNALSMMVSYDNFGDDLASWTPPRTERDGFWEKTGPGMGSDRRALGFPSGLKEDVTVCKTGGCGYKTVQDAVNSAPDNSVRSKFVIKISEGVYEETVRIPFEKKNVVFIGDGMGKTVITGSLNARMPGMSTFKSATVATFQEIINGSLDSNFLIDVVGQATEIGDMQVVPVQSKETKKLELTLRDTDGLQIACCLWGRFAEHMLYAYKVAQVDKNFICLLRFAKINVYKGQVQVTSAFEISSVEINPSGFDVNDYLMMPDNKLALTAGSLEVVKPQGNKRQPDKWSLYPERTILDIVMATEIEKCIVRATVYAIDTDYAWYYFGCIKCHYKKVTNITNKDLVPVKHLWYCETCHQSVTNVAPKFKLHLLLKDETGETKVMLLDTIAEPILGISAEVLLNGSLEEVEDPEDLPDVITDMIGKTFKFGVYVSKDNVDYGSNIFNIGKTWSADEIILQSDDDKTEDTNQTDIVSSDRPSEQVSFVSIESEDNTCSSSTPLSKRKVDKAVHDISSTSKKRYSKIIKVEKNAGE